MTLLALAACAPEPRRSAGWAVRGEVDGAPLVLDRGFFTEDEGAGAWTAVLTAGPGCADCAAHTERIDRIWDDLAAGALDAAGACEALVAAEAERWGEAPFGLQVTVRAADAVALLAGRYDVDVDLVEHALPTGLCPPVDPEALRADLRAVEAHRTHAAVGTLRVDGYTAGERIHGSLDLEVHGLGALAGTYDVPACGAPVDLGLTR